MNLEASRLLEAVAEVLDIPDELYEEAVAKYTDLGTWLERKDAALHRNPPEVYPQGSFRLGTIIRPLSDDDEYDIDLVYKRDLKKESTTQDQLKREAGEHLAEYVEEKQKAGDDRPELADEGRRCWTLQYPERFHMDVLPAIPDPDGRAIAILITDKEFRRWQHSNPIEYAEWFKARMMARFLEKRAAMAQAIKASVEDVPEWKVKTALQRAVQILKRHRDVRFQDDPHDVKPASIIISTLAAKAYDNEADLAAAITKLVRHMPKYIEKRDGVYWVPNPVNPEENFADRWIGRPDRVEAFSAWLDALQADLTAASEATDIVAVGERLKACFGESAVNEAVGQAGRIVKTAHASLADVPPRADSSHCQAPIWPIQPKFRAKLKGSVRKKIGQPKELWLLTGRPVPKDLAIRFNLETNVREPFEVKWQVVNTGQEARDDNGLRGEFHASRSDDKCVNWESTKYAGTHWIEAFVIQDGVCVARTDRKYVRIR